ncbi:hypothetical protein HHI36_015561 [Cryptolaemus montrouzieri]|uniref:DDE-1 domain-containing protein n=1 Tax=Cryptolaemus montrouzieri TaxID=559131 RepID=A0ABD2N6F5_9CUCU
MDQSVIEILKRLYRKQLQRRLLSVEEDNVEVVLSFFKEMNLKECCYLVVDAWDLIEMKTSNDEIVENILQINEQQEMQEDETEENIDEENDTGPFHDVEFRALDSALKWFENKQSDTVSLLQLKRIRDIAAMKRKSCLRQMTITKCFKPN